MSVPRSAKVPVPAPCPRGHKQMRSTPPKNFCKGFPLKNNVRRGEPPATTKAHGGEGGCGEGEEPVKFGVKVGGGKSWSWMRSWSWSLELEMEFAVEFGGVRRKEADVGGRWW